MSYIGVDLHTTQITVCYLKAEADFEIRKYQLIEMDKFVNTLEAGDQIAVEATGNTRWFSEQVREKVRRVVVVNPRQFEVVKNSCKKTDKNDALNLARFLRADLLPEVRAKREAAMRVQSLVQTRTKLVRFGDEFNQQNSRPLCRKWMEVKENESGIGERVGNSSAF